PPQVGEWFDLVVVGGRDDHLHDHRQVVRKLVHEVEERAHVLDGGGKIAADADALIGVGRRAVHRDDEKIESALEERLAFAVVEVGGVGREPHGHAAAAAVADELAYFAVKERFAKVMQVGELELWDGLVDDAAKQLRLHVAYLALHLLVGTHGA